MANQNEAGLEAALHSAYSYVRGIESNKSVAAFTLDHLIQQHIDDIEGSDSSTKPTRLQLLDELEKNLDDAVSAVVGSADV
jgi:hypothetical protein